jgi:hypothetical protein
MIKLILGVSRRADWSREEWLTHYQERHGPLVAGLRLFGSHTRKYVQNYAIWPEETSGITNHVDGISELWFNDIESLKAAYADPAYMDLVRPDELCFCDLNSVIGGIGHEYPVLVEATENTDKTWVRKSRVRLIIFRIAADGLSDAALRNEWLSAADEISHCPSFARYVRAYVQTHLRNDESPLPSGSPFGVIDEFWFQTEADAFAYWRDISETGPIRRLALQFTAPASAITCLVRGHAVFLDPSDRGQA